MQSFYIFGSLIIYWFFHSLNFLFISPMAVNKKNTQRNKKITEQKH